MTAVSFAPDAPPSLSDQIALFGNLARFLKSGMPLAAGFAHIREQCSSGLRPVLERLQHALEERHVPLSQAFRDHYPGGDEMLLAVIEQGETSGTLETSFRQLEDAAKRRLERRRKLIRELAYPAFVAVAFLGIWPLPSLFRDGVASYLVRAVPPLVALGAAAWAALVLWPRARFDPVLARRADATLLGLPFVGRPLRAALMARFARALSLLVGAGLPLDRSLTLSGAAAGSPSLEMRLRLVAAEVRHGHPLSELLAPLSDLLSPSFLAMVKTGEATGALDTTLTHAADLYDEEAQQAQDLAIRLAGPAMNIMILLIGGAFVVNAYRGYLDLLGSIQ